MNRRRTRSSPARRVPQAKRGGSRSKLDDLIDAADTAALVELVRRLAAVSPEAERRCFEYLRDRAAKSPDAKAGAAAGAAHAIWSELEPDLAELDEYGGGDYDTQDHVGNLLHDLEQTLEKYPVPVDDRRDLLDKILPFIRSGNAGMDDALYDVAYAACHDDADLRDLAERFEGLGRSWARDHARRIYRRLGDRQNYLRLRRERMQYGADYHELATFHWEQGEPEKALEIARQGLETAEGRMDELRGFLADRARDTGDRDGYLELQFAQATERPTLASYKAFQKLCTTSEWARYERRMLAAVEDAWEEERLKIHMHRKEYDAALKILTAMDYPDERYGPNEVLQVAAQLEEKYPEEILAFYLSGLPERYFNPTRNMYAGWAQVARRVRHMWVDVLKAPAKWEVFAKQLKAANARRPAFQQEFSKVVPGWNRL